MSCSPLAALAAEEVTDTFRVIDITCGLPENRTRAVRQLGDGRLAVVTAGMLSIYDYTGFLSRTPSSSSYYNIGAVNSYRSVSVDGHDRVWTKFKGALLAFDTGTGTEVDIDSLFRRYGVRETVNNFFTSPAGDSFIVGSNGDLMLHNEAEGLRMIGNINDIDKAGLRSVHAHEGRVVLCYQGGRLVVVDRATGGRLFNGRGVDPKYGEYLSRNLVSVMAGGKLHVAVNFERERKCVLFCFDVKANRLLHSRVLPIRISSLASVSGGLLAAGSGNAVVYLSEGGEMLRTTVIAASDNHEISPMESEIMDVAEDRFGGLWVATLDKGLMYLNRSREAVVETLTEAYPYEKNSIFCSERARRVGESVQPRLTGSSLEDEDGRLYLASVGGLKIFDENDVLIADLDRRSGLASDNVYGICADARGDVWLSHPSALSRVRISGDTAAVTTFNYLDGIRLAGGEFGQRMIFCDSIGRICVGFSGGMCRLDPKTLPSRLYCARVPLKAESAKGDEGGRWWLYALATVAFLTACGAGIFLFRCRSCRSRYPDHEPGEQRVQSVQESGGDEEAQEAQDNLDRIMKVSYKGGDNPDTVFLDKLKATVEANISDPDFSVRRLSELMSMERSGLYRKMQALTGITPSEYIKEIQLSLAAQILASGDADSIAGVAERVGFSDPKYFSKVFKSRYGKSPKAFMTDGPQAES